MEHHHRCSRRVPPLEVVQFQQADANIARRGPASSNQRPNVKAESPRKTIATEKTQPIVESVQSQGGSLTRPAGTQRDGTRQGRAAPLPGQNIPTGHCVEAVGEVDPAGHPYPGVPPVQTPLQAALVRPRVSPYVPAGQGQGA